MSAREKAAAARADQRRAAQRKRAVTIVSAVVVIIVVGAGIALYTLTRPAKSSPVGDRSAGIASVIKAATNVAQSTLEKVGAGNVLTMPSKVSGEPPLTANGKPELLYIGAEFCPYCAVERWALAESLSKFGTFNGVGEVSSGTDDGDYASLDFYKTTYTSKYLTFSPVENQDRLRNQLEPVTKAQNALWSKLSGGKEGFPFIDFGNKYAITTAPLDPAVLGTMSQAQIASQLNDPSSKVEQTIGGGANDITAAICAMTNNQPAAVCSSSTVTSLEGKINA
jgi:hypothetical protein